jgi:16S rRNA (uracil1498-N3)-methyltransferase
MAEALRDRATHKAAILIGPEGGFTPEERERIRSLPSAVPVSLGPRILRADTAAVAALTIWQSQCGDWAGGAQPRD